MSCTKCHGLTIELERILDMQHRVTLTRCLICNLEVEHNHTPEPIRTTGQGRPREYAGWRAPAKPHDMEA